MFFTCIITNIKRHKNCKTSCLQPIIGSSHPYVSISFECSGARILLYGKAVFMFAMLEIK